MREPFEWADELVIRCMALFLGKDIMQISKDSKKTNPWYIIPGQVEGWPDSVTTPPLTIANINQLHFEPIEYKLSTMDKSTCIGCGWSGKILKNHLSQSIKLCKKFYNMQDLSIHINTPRVKNPNQCSDLNNSNILKDKITKSEKKTY